MSLVPPPSFAIVLRGGRPRKQGQLVMNLEVVGAAEGNGEIVVEAAVEGHVSQQSDTRRRKEEEANTTHYLSFHMHPPTYGRSTEEEARTQNPSFA